LFKTEEFEDGEIDGGMETKTTFIGSEGRVELVVRRYLEAGRLGRDNHD